MLDLSGVLALGFKTDLTLGLAAGLEEAFTAGLAACLGADFDGDLLKGLADLAIDLFTALGLGFAAAIVFFLPRG